MRALREEKIDNLPLRIPLEFPPMFRSRDARINFSHIATSRSVIIFMIYMAKMGKRSSATPHKLIKMVKLYGETRERQQNKGDPGRKYLIKVRLSRIRKADTKDVCEHVGSKIRAKRHKNEQPRALKAVVRKQD